MASVMTDQAAGMQAYGLLPEAERVFIRALAEGRPLVEASQLAGMDVQQAQKFATTARCHGGLVSYHASYLHVHMTGPALRQLRNLAAGYLETPEIEHLIDGRTNVQIKRIPVGAPVVLGAVQTVLKLARLEDVIARPLAGQMDLEDMSLDDLRQMLSGIEQRLGDAATDVSAQSDDKAQDLPSDYSVLD